MAILDMITWWYDGMMAWWHLVFYLAWLVYNLCPTLIEILKKLIGNFSADHHSIWRPIKRGKHQKDWSIWKEKSQKNIIYVMYVVDPKKLSKPQKSRKGSENGTAHNQFRYEMHMLNGQFWILNWQVLTFEFKLESCN